jgi:hypothetical protein
MRYERVKVKRDTNTVHNRAVAPWEIPVLEFLFEDGNVERTGQFEEVAGEYPGAANELDRLVRCYGSDPKSGVPYANSVYGNARAGERSLAKLIEDARSEDEAAAEEKAHIPAPTTKRGRKAQATESLLS